MRIYQLVTSLQYGDAISNEVLAIDRILKSLNIETKIFGYHHHPKLAKYFTNYTEYFAYSSKKNLLIFHFSIGSPVSKVYFQVPDKKIMIYHNITPYNFFLYHHRGLAKDCYKGRREIKNFVSKTDLALGDSEFNRKELEKLGFKKTGVLPIVMDYSKFEREGSETVKQIFSDGKFNILFVGRMIPNKKIDELIKFFVVYKKYFNPNSRLIIVGDYRGFERYMYELYQIGGKFGVKDIIFTGHISLDDLIAFYKVADLYISLSEHEGFGVPLLEAFYMEVPVLGYDAGAVKETMNGGGIVIKRKKFDELSALVEEIRLNDDFRERIISSQRKALEKYSEENLKKTLINHLKVLGINL